MFGVSTRTGETLDRATRFQNTMFLTVSGIRSAFLARRRCLEAQQ